MNIIEVSICKLESGEKLQATECRSLLQELYNQRGLRQNFFKDIPYKLFPCSHLIPEQMQEEWKKSWEYYRLEQKADFLWQQTIKLNQTEGLLPFLQQLANCQKAWTCYTRVFTSMKYNARQHPIMPGEQNGGQSYYNLASLSLKQACQNLPPVIQKHQNYKKWQDRMPEKYPAFWQAAAICEENSRLDLVVPLLNAGEVSSLFLDHGEQCHLSELHTTRIGVGVDSMRTDQKLSEYRHHYTKQKICSQIQLFLTSGELSLEDKRRLYFFTQNLQSMISSKEASQEDQDLVNRALLRLNNFAIPYERLGFDTSTILFFNLRPVDEPYPMGEVSVFGPSWDIPPDTGITLQNILQKADPKKFPLFMELLEKNSYDILWKELGEQMVYLNAQAFHEKKISCDDYLTLHLQWEALQEWDSGDNIEWLSIDDEGVQKYLQQVVLKTPTFQMKDQHAEERFGQFNAVMSKKSDLAKSVLKIDVTERVNDLLFLEDIIHSAAFTPFMPLQQKGRTYLYVFSFDAIQTCLDVTFLEQSIKGIPQIGLSHWNMMKELCLHNMRPVCLFYPGQIKDKPHGMICDLYSASLHDIYHLYRASLAPQSHRRAFIELSNAIELFAKDPAQENHRSKLGEWAAALVDQESSEYLVLIDKKDLDLPDYLLQSFAGKLLTSFTYAKISFDLVLCIVDKWVKNTGQDMGFPLSSLTNQLKTFHAEF